MSILAALRRRSSQDEDVTTTAGTTPSDQAADEASDEFEDDDEGETFESLGIAPDLVAVLARNGVTTPFPVQILTIPEALEGRDVCGRARTGSGKTLAFGLPLIERTQTSKRRRPQSLILVPTRELATQVAVALTPLAKERGLWLAPIYGGVSMVRQIKALQQGVDIVIATPGRLNDLIDRGEVSMADVRFVVVDEADQMSDMGFLPQVRQILDLVDGKPQTLLFSATLDGAVGELIERYQRDPVHHEVRDDEDDVSLVTQRFIVVDPSDMVDATLAITAGAKRALVFVSTTHGADRLVTSLERGGAKAAAIHGRLSQAKRERTLTDFRKASIQVLVATNVAARGIHVDDVDVVVHYDPPEDAKVYLHRSGRTARAGADGLVVTLVLPQNAVMMTRLQREIGVDQELIQMRPNDPRLADLVAWEPPRAAYPAANGRYSMSPLRAGQRGGGGGRRPSNSGPPRGYGGGTPAGAVRGGGRDARNGPRAATRGRSWR